jgi:hypothetical protein
VRRVRADLAAGALGTASWVIRTVRAIDAVVAMTLPAGTLRDLVRRDANKVLDHPSDGAARDWLVTLARRLADGRDDPEPSVIVSQAYLDGTDEPASSTPAEPEPPPRTVIRRRDAPWIELSWYDGAIAMVLVIARNQRVRWRSQWHGKAPRDTVDELVRILARRDILRGADSGSPHYDPSYVVRVHDESGTREARYCFETVMGARCGVSEGDNALLDALLALTRRF